MFDDNTLNDRADGDGAILTLFHEWQTAWTASNASDEEDNETLANELWRRLCDLPASGPIGIAIKAYLVARREYANESPLGLRAFNASDYGAGDNLFLDARAYRGLLADAARFVPELAPLMAEIVAAPDGFPPLLASDEELIAAEGELAALRSRRAELTAAGDHSAHPEITARWVALEEAIGRSPANGLIGAAVKLRQLADPKEGLAVGIAESDVISVQQVLAVVERELAAGEARP